MQQFWPVVALATSLTAFMGSYLINRYKTKFFGFMKKEPALDSPSFT